jgi:hypothetical protein
MRTNRNIKLPSEPAVERGLTEDDVPRRIAETRGERTRYTQDLKAINRAAAELYSEVVDVLRYQVLDEPL